MIVVAMPAVTVERTRSVIGSRQDLASITDITTLELQFRFEGKGVTGRNLSYLLLNAPLIGPDSLLGDVAGNEDEEARTDKSRTVRGLSQVPFFSMDVEFMRVDNGVDGSPTFLVRFSQPDAWIPSMTGDALWTFKDEAHSGGRLTGTTFLNEEINTARAGEAGAELLTGRPLSLHRALFFRVGHPNLMARVAENLAVLLQKSCPDLPGGRGSLRYVDPEFLGKK